MTADPVRWDGVPPALAANGMQTNWAESASTESNRPEAGHPRFRMGEGSAAHGDASRHGRHRTFNPKVAGSIPARPITRALHMGCFSSAPVRHGGRCAYQARTRSS